MNCKKPVIIAFVTGLALPIFAAAAPATYTLDPDHTHPAFEVDHLGGLSVWRGNFKKSSGTVVLDRDAKTGTVDVTVDLASVDMAHDHLSEGMLGPAVFDVANYPTAHYTGTLGDFVDGAPTTVTGEMNLHGITKPLNLKILKFKCMPHPFFKREVCGADAFGTFNREDFGIHAGKSMGFTMNVILRIQVEALINQ
jgi:polyisoprenoid-binding protein YceI